MLLWRFPSLNYFCKLHSFQNSLKDTGMIGWPVEQLTRGEVDRGGGARGSVSGRGTRSHTCGSPAAGAAAAEEPGLEPRRSEAAALNPDLRNSENQFFTRGETPQAETTLRGSAPIPPN
ncbi:hypothetical protein AOLI_G00273500 [Acnodon oligacanthus]